MKALAAFRPADFKPRVGLLLGLTDPVCGLNMGETAELLARELGLTRARQDAFAIESHKRALAAREKIAAEICPVFNAAGTALTTDNGPRTDQTPKPSRASNPFSTNATAPSPPPTPRKSLTVPSPSSS